MPKTALLVIDAQVGIIEGPSVGPVYNKEQVLQVIGSVIQQARELHIPIIYIQDLNVGEDNPEQQQIHPLLSPRPSDIVIQKKATNVFFLTNLHETLQSLGAEHLVITGMKTEYCVDTTSRAATVLGYDVTLVADGHSTTDSRVLLAVQIIQHHNCHLHGLDNVSNFILVRNSEENVFEHKHLEYK